MYINILQWMDVIHKYIKIPLLITLGCLFMFIFSRFWSYKLVHFDGTNDPPYWSAYTAITIRSFQKGANQ